MCRRVFTSDELHALEIAFERASAVLGYAARDYGRRQELALLMFSLAEDDEFDVGCIEEAAVNQLLRPH
jgi:hypothetical protein